MNDDLEQKYPVKDYTRMTFAFDGQELRKLTSLDTINQMGQMAQMMISQVLQSECMPRVGAKNSKDVGVVYDIPKGQFVVFTPRVWCSACKIRKAIKEYKGEYFCEDCLKARMESVIPMRKGKK